jgi:hypothetical protein
MRPQSVRRGASAELSSRRRCRFVLEQVAKELLEQRWKKVTTAKLPDTTELLASTQRIG